MTLNNSTLIGNSAASGGAIFYSGTLNGSLTVNDSTISGNSASGTGNSGGGIASSGTLTLVNTLVAGNSALAGALDPDVAGVVTSASTGNLIGDGTGLSGISNGTSNNQVGTSSQPINPFLAPLAGNGGFTQTMALQAGSPALGTGVAISGLTTDQRSEPRPAHPDIGAFQSNVPGPTITSLSQTSGTLLGGTSVTLTGTNLVNATAVMFGTMAATITSTTGTTLVVITPAFFAGPVNVTVTTPGGSAVSPQQFTYLSTPSVTGVTPAAGPVSGGTAVTITGMNLGTAQTATVRFGTTPATITSDNGTTLVVTAPAGLAGTAYVTVMTANGSSLPAPFTYVAPPALTSISQTSGTTLGGTSVTLTGTNLANAAAVYFGTTPALITSNTGTTLVVTTPAGLAGAVSVTVSTAAGTATSPQQFTFVAPAFTSPNAAVVKLDQVTAIPITTANLPGAVLRLSGSVPGGVMFVDNGNGTATLTAPSTLASGVYQLTITAKNGSSARIVQAFTLTVVN